MAVVTPGTGRFKPDTGAPDKNYSSFLDWFSRKDDGTTSWVRRTAVRPIHMRPGTIPELKRQRMLLANCSKKWAALSDAQKTVWKTICVQVVRPKHRGLTATWSVKGRKAFMSSCLLGFIRSCDRIDTPPDIPPDTYITILMFHFRFLDINLNPINKLNVKIISKTLKSKDGTDKVMYDQVTDITGYPPDFGMAANFQPFDILASKIYESQKKTITVVTDMTVELIIC